MLKLAVGSAALAVSLLAAVHAGHAADKKYVFALVPKATDNPFYDQARNGCKKAEAEANGAFECLYVGPSQHGGGDEQVQLVEDLVTKHVDGIAVSPSNAAAIVVALADAKKAGIPVLTWDSDVLPKDKGLRLAYIGTHNYEIGVNLAKLVQKIKPHGGTVCIQSGGAAAANHNERMQGIRDTLAGVSGTEPPGPRLTGQNGWTEVDGCPLYTNDDFPLAMQQEQDILVKYPKLDVFFATGGFGEFLERAYVNAMTPFKARIADHEVAVAVADTLPMQIAELKDGLASGNVGQRPFEMGYQVMKAFLAIKEGKAPPKDPTYTGLDVCTPQNASTCVGGGS